MTSATSPPLDPEQLARIEAVHRGFLYQHLYAVACLLSAQNVGATSIVVERDEDLEIVFPSRRVYIQIKTRSSALVPSDIDTALERFNALRLEHEAKRRQGDPSFVVAANVNPGPVLLERLQGVDWPRDVAVYWPGKPMPEETLLPAPSPDIRSALGNCAEVAGSLPYALLAPETLVWKLAGNVMAAAAGTPPRADHTFQTAELPILFEQVVIQLQDFPAPPTVYRTLTDEPALQSEQRVRIVMGYSGAGKTAWASQAALHATGTVTYFDVTETPGPALAASLAREVAARMFGRTGGGLRDVLLPGSSGPEILGRIGTRLAESGQQLTIVLDNAHRIPPPDVQTLVQHASGLKFVLLCHPGHHIHELEARLSVSVESLPGWSVDTIALEVADRHCRADYAACERLARLTAGLPLYVQNAIVIAASQYDGSISRLCDDLEARTHVVETAQELILARTLDALPPGHRDGLAALSLSDIPLARADASKVLSTVFGLKQTIVAAVLRDLRSSGCLEVFGSDRLKVHDAMRLLGQGHLERIGRVAEARVALRNVLLDSLAGRPDLAKTSLLVRMLAATGEIKTLVEMATDELFHELGIYGEIHAFLEAAATSDKTDPEQRFWALDGLVFADLKRGDVETAAQRQGVMAHLIADHHLGVDEVLALSMKRMYVIAARGDDEAVFASIREIFKLLPSAPRYQRIFRYNAANALFQLGKHDAASDQAKEVAEEYFDVLGITPRDIVGRNPDKIWPLLKKSPNRTDDLKHLGDCLDLQAQAVNAAGRPAPPFNRINAMKFYAMANALDSLVRVGQDLVDEFVQRHDFIGARQVMETNLLPHVLELKMLGRIIPVRSQYAVVLAYCGDFDSADAEMERLTAYEAGLDERGQRELQSQRHLIAEIRTKGPPPQWIPSKAKTMIASVAKAGRNAPCPCGSGKKYKKCHGATR